MLNLRASLYMQDKIDFDTALKELGVQGLARIGRRSSVPFADLGHQTYI
jgi:hypothetical protein